MSNVTYLGYVGDNNDSSSYTVSGATMGTPHPERVIVLAFSIASGHSLTGLSVGGLAATLIARDTTAIATEIWAISKPTGTSANIQVTATGIGNSFSWYAVNTKDGVTPYDSINNDGATSLTIDSVEIGSIIGVISTRTDSTFDDFAWSGSSTPVTDVRHVFGSSIRHGATCSIDVVSGDNLTAATLSVANATDSNSITAVSFRPPTAEVDAPVSSFTLGSSTPTLSISVSFDVPVSSFEFNSYANTVRTPVSFDIPTSSFEFDSFEPSIHIPFTALVPVSQFEWSFYEPTLYHFVANSLETTTELGSPEAYNIEVFAQGDSLEVLTELSNPFWFYYGNYDPNRTALVQNLQPRTVLVQRPLDRTSVVPKVAERKVKVL